MKKMLILTTVLSAMLLSLSASAAGVVRPEYVVVIKNGSWETVSYGNDSYLNVSSSATGVSKTYYACLPLNDVDAVRAKMECDGCTTSTDWGFYDTVQNSWRTSCDLEGYHNYSNGSWYYRGEEDGAIENDDYTSLEGLMNVKWGSNNWITWKTYCTPAE